jgi:DegV family protein with EDD domain
LYLDIFEDAKAKGDDVLVLTLSSQISGTYNSAIQAQGMTDYKNITILDSKQASVSQRMLAERAVQLRDEGKTREEVVEALKVPIERLRIMPILDTLTYLKKGGRVPPAMALIGNALKVKPVLFVEDGTIKPLGKARGYQAGKQIAWNKVEEEGVDESIQVCFGYTQDKAKGEAFMAETAEKFGLKNCRLFPVGGVIGTHAGPGAVTIGFMVKR